MSESANTAKGSSWWKSVKAQFHRIIWPTKEDVTKQSAVVIVVSVLLGVINKEQSVRETGKTHRSPRARHT